MRMVKNSGIEWIGEIPIEWSVMPNKYLMCKVKHICPIYGGGDILSLTINGVVVRDLDAGGKMPQSFDGYQHISSGNLLMCLFDIDVTPRCVGLIKSNGLTSPAYSQFSLKNIANPDYYCYYYTMLDNDKTLLHLAKNLRHSLTEEQLGNIFTIVPPLCEQEKIAAYLDRKCTEIDALTTDIQKQIETLEEYKRSVITEAVTKGLDPDVKMKDSGVEWVGEIPANWETHPLYCYFGERKRINILGKEDNLLSLSYGKVIQKDINALGGLLPESFNTYNIVEPNDIIIRPTDLQNDKRSLRTGLCTQHGIITTAYIALKPIVKLNSAFFHYLLHSFDVAKVFYNMGNGVRQGLNFGEFSKLTVFFPSLQEQDKIAAYLDRKCSEIDCIIKDKKQQLETLSEYKKSLIYEYVTGKKVVAAEITVSMVDPLLLLIAKILDNMPLNEGKIRVIKLALLSEYMYIPELETQYYRYKQGPYDVNIDKRLNEINKLGWFDISVDESPMKWKKGKKYNKFKQQSQQYDQYDDKITALINSIGHYKESHIGRIATLFSVWNDFIIEGIPNPSDEQIIQEVINNWTPNKAKTAKSVWQHTLDEMKTKGIIPHGKGLHTKKREENT